MKIHESVWQVEWLGATDDGGSVSHLYLTLPMAQRAIVGNEYTKKAYQTVISSHDFDPAVHTIAETR